MSWHLSSVLFFLLLMCCTYGPVYGVNTMKNSVDIFVPGQTKVPDKVGDLNPVKDVKFFYSPVLVGADDVMTVLASTDYTDKGNKNTDIVARYIGTHGMNWAEKVTESNGGNWKTQLAFQKVEEGVTYSYQLIRPMAVAKGNKIYLLVLSQTQIESKTWINPDWDFELTVGEVMPISNAQLGEKTIEWQRPKSLVSTLTKEFKDNSMRAVLSGGSAFLQLDERIVFVVKAFKGTKSTLAIVHLIDKGKEIGFDWSEVEISKNCYFHSVFGWGTKLIMVTYCTDGSYSVKESTDMGKTWGGATGSISRLWHYWNGILQFTTATIGNRPVLFLSEMKRIGTTIDSKNAMYLGVTDGNRLYRVEPIVVDNNFVTCGGLLYTNGKLFSLCEQTYTNKSNHFFLTHLKDELEVIESVLQIWAENDNYFSKLCRETLPQGVSSETFCLTPFPTDGLVGLLSNTSTGNSWFDEYLLIGAMVKGGVKVDNGFMFSGTGSGAWWPVGANGVNDRYNFARYGLTVVATVTIYNIPGTDSPLITVGKAGDKQLLGLWYGKDMQWKVMSDDGGAPAGHWEMDKTYRVALKLEKNSLFAYVDGKSVGRPLQILPTKEETLDIRELFIGEYETDNAKGSSGYFTVTNVFLYNRPLRDIELEALNKKIPATPKLTTRTSEQTPRPTNAPKPSEAPTKQKNVRESSVHVEVGATLFFLLALLGIAALC